jgi:hypothetical protein
MLELGYQKDGEEREVEVGYRIYISGDTLMGELISLGIISRTAGLIWPRIAVDDLKVSVLG